MITLNKDYSELKSQIAYTKNYLNTCFNSLEVYDYMELYKSLKDATRKVELPFMWDFPREQWEIYKTEEQRDKYLKKECFSKEELFLKEYLQTTHHAIGELLDEIEDFRDDIDGKEIHTFGVDCEEPEELLYEFLKEEDKALKEIYEDMKQYKRIYYNKVNLDAHAIYNNLKKIPSIFIPIKSFDIEDVAILIHELGHILDNTELCNHSMIKSHLYPSCSIYQEVPSYYYEQKFLEFLIENGKYQIDAQNVLLDNLELLEENIKRDIKTISKKVYNSDNLFDSIQYSIGQVIAPMLDKEITKSQFSSFQCDYFNHNKLEELGLTAKNTSNCYIKKMKNMIIR